MLGASGEVGPAWDGAEGGNRRFLVTEFILVSRGEVLRKPCQSSVNDIKL